MISYTPEELYSLYLSVLQFPIEQSIPMLDVDALDEFDYLFLNPQGIEIFNDISVLSRLDAGKYFTTAHMKTSRDLYFSILLRRGRFCQGLGKDSSLDVLFRLPHETMPLFIGAEPPKNVIAQWRLKIGK